MGDEDVKVTIGANISPFQEQMARVKIAGKEAADSLGIEFGRGTQRAEMRVERGVNEMLKNLAAAKDPIQALDALVGGLGKTFAIASSAFLGVAIGAFLKDQLEEAAQGAQDFYSKTDDIFSLANSSSKEFTEKAIKNFEDAKEAYGKEGLFEYLIYGSGQKKTLENGEAAYQQAIAKARAIREAEYKTEAEKGSDDPKIKLQGEIDAINEMYDEKVAKAKEANDDIRDIELSRVEAIKKAEKEADGSYEKNAKEAANLRDQTQAEKDKQGEIGKSLEDKLADANAKLKADQDKLTASGDANNEADVVAQEKMRLEIEKDITKQKELSAQVDAKAAEAAAKKISKYLTPEQMDKLQDESNKKKIEAADKLKEEQSKRSDLLKDEKSARSDVATTQADAMGFHGTVSSLRREGFGKTPGASKDGAQLKAAQAAVDRLDKVQKEIAALNAKIGGSA